MKVTLYKYFFIFFRLVFTANMNENGYKYTRSKKLLVYMFRIYNLL